MSAAAALLGSAASREAHSHRTGQPVRRHSFDVDDPRADVFRPIEGGMRFVRAFVETLEEWADLTKEPGKQHELNGNAVKVLRVLLRSFTDFPTGICEPAIDTICAKAKLARATVVRALAKLREHGFIDWVRRTMRTDAPPGEGPQVEQVSNAYFFELRRLPERALARLRQKLAREGVEVRPDPEPRQPLFGRGVARSRRLFGRRAQREDLAARLAAAPLAGRAALLYPNDPEKQREFNEMLLGVEREGASSAAGQNPGFSALRDEESGRYGAPTRLP